LPAGEQTLEHRDGTLSERRFGGHVGVHRQRAAKGDADEQNRGERGQQADRRERNRRLVAERAEVVNAGEAHYPQLETLVLERLDHFE
jgi:hypothetical protein